MSARHFHGRAYGRESLQRTQFADIGDHGFLDGFLDGLSRALLACIDSVDGVTLRQKLYTYDLLGLSLDGVVVLHTFLTRHSISQIRGELLTFLPGQICFEGQPRDIIRMDFERDVVCKPISSFPGHSVQPIDIASALRSRFLFSSTGDTLWVRHEILKGSELFTVAHPVRISVAIEKILVAQPCRHAYDTAFTPEIVHQSEMLLNFSSGFELCADTQASEEKDINGSAEGSWNLYYQLADKNDMGQWLACQWQPGYMDYNSVLILQDTSCLKCVVQRIIDGGRELRRDHSRTMWVGIIAGSKNDRE